MAVAEVGGVMACDICGAKACTQTLSQRYQSTDIKEVCKECMSDISVQHDKIRTHCIGMISPFFKRYQKLYKFNKRRAKRDK